MQGNDHVYASAGRLPERSGREGAVELSHVAFEQGSNDSLFYFSAVALLALLALARLCDATCLVPLFVVPVGCAPPPMFVVSVRSMAE